MTRLFRELGEGVVLSPSVAGVTAEVDGARTNGLLGAGASSGGATPVIGAHVSWESPAIGGTRVLGISGFGAPVSGESQAIGGTRVLGISGYRSTGVPGISGYRSTRVPRGVLAYTASKISGALYYIGVGKAVQRATAMDVAPDGLQLGYASAE